jgi:hypothetical protein
MGSVYGDVSVIESPAKKTFTGIVVTVKRAARFEFARMKAGDRADLTATSFRDADILCMNVRRTLLWMLAACLVVGESRFARAAEPAPPASPPRFLFIVEKSAATAALGLDLPQTLFDLVYRGANGHLPYGGVFEIWVFGEETIIRGFTPQMLLPNNRLQLARMASAYVRTASSGGEVAVGKMVEHLLGATEMAQELTVFLLTAPGTRLSGTPRDAELNLIFDTNAEAQRVAGRPFITAIRIQDGLLAATSVSDSPFTMTVPPMPPTRMTPQQREALIAETRRLREEREKPPVVPKAVPVAEPAPQLAERNLPEAEPKAVDTVKPETVVSEPAAGAVAAEPVIVAAGAATPPVAGTGPGTTGCQSPRQRAGGGDGPATRTGIAFANHDRRFRRAGHPAVSGSGGHRGQSGKNSAAGSENGGDPAARP